MGLWGLMVGGVMGGGMVEDGDEWLRGSTGPGGLWGEWAECGSGGLGGFVGLGGLWGGLWLGGLWGWMGSGWGWMAEGVCGGYEVDGVGMGVHSWGGLELGVGGLHMELNGWRGL